MGNKEAILKLKKAGVRNSQIAEVLGISKQYVSRISKASGITQRTNNRIYKNGTVPIGFACEFLNVPKTTLRRWSDDGTIPTLRVNGRRDRMYKISDLLSYIHDNPIDEPLDY